MEHDRLLEMGFSAIQEYTGTSKVTRATQSSALPSLTVAHALLSKFGSGLDELTESGMADQLKGKLIERWKSLPEFFVLNFLPASQGVSESES